MLKYQLFIKISLKTKKKSLQKLAIPKKQPIFAVWNGVLQHGFNNTLKLLITF